MIHNVVIVSLVSFLMNIPLGAWRAQQRKFSAKWFIAVHASVPFIIALRIWLDTNTAFIALFIAIAVLGQFVGAKLSSCCSKPAENSTEL